MRTLARLVAALGLSVAALSIGFAPHDAPSPTPTAPTAVVAAAPHSATPNHSQIDWP